MIHIISREDNWKCTKYRTLFNQKTKKEYFAECFKEYVGGHQEKVKPFHSYMKTITQKIRQKNKWAMQKAWLMNKKNDIMCLKKKTNK